MVSHSINVLIDLQSNWRMIFLKTECQSAPSIVSFASAVKVAAEIAMKSWQRKWELEVTAVPTLDS